MYIHSDMYFFLFLQAFPSALLSGTVGRPIGRVMPWSHIFVYIVPVIEECEWTYASSVQPMRLDDISATVAIRKALASIHNC